MPVAHREITKKHIKRIVEEEAKKNSGTPRGVNSFEYYLRLIRVEDGKLIPNHDANITYFCYDNDPEWLRYGKEITNVTDIKLENTISAGDYLVFPSQGFGWYIYFPYAWYSKNEDGDLVSYLHIKNWSHVNNYYPILTDWKFKKGKYIESGIIDRSDAETDVSNAPLIYGTSVLTLEEDIPNGIYHFQDTSGYLRKWKEINFNESEDNKNETEQ